MDGEVVAVVDDQGRDFRVVTSKDDETHVVATFDGHTLEGWLVVDEASADSPLNMFGVDAGAVLDKHEITGF